MNTDFELPIRYKLGYANPYGDSEEMSMNNSKEGDYVSYYAYKLLLTNILN